RSGLLATSRDCGIPQDMALVSMFVWQAVMSVALAAAAGLLGACGNRAPAVVDSTAAHTTIVARTQTPAPLPTAAIDEGPVSAVPGVCPYLDVSTAQDEEGNRIGGTVVLRASGRTAGCRFSYLYDGHPVLEISSARYRSATLAYNAMVRLGQTGTHQI